MKTFQGFTRLNVAVLVVPLLLATPVLAADAADVADAPKAASDWIFVNPADLKWQDAPPSLPKGAKIAVLYGDPTIRGPSS